MPYLKDRLVGATIIDCFSQNKNELVIQLANNNSEEFTIIAHLNPQFTCLAFPKDYHKARKNAATIFSPLMQLKVNDVKGFINERAFIVHFQNNYFYMYNL